MKHIKDFNDYLYESQSVDILHSIKQIKDFNKGIGNYKDKDITTLADYIMLHLGYDPSDDTRDIVINHLSASMDDNERIPEDATLIREIIAEVENA